MEEPIKVFIAGTCQPCQEIKDLIEAGRFSELHVDLIDLESEEGFPYVEKMKLSKVPTAYKGTKQCSLKIDDAEHILIIDCPEDNPPI